MGNVTVTIMGRRGPCVGKYKSGQRKGRACEQQGSIRINGESWCGSHVRGKLRELGADRELSELGILDLQDRADDKHLACEICKVLYSSKEVDPSLYRSNVWDAVDDAGVMVDETYYGNGMKRVCKDCFQEIAGCDECEQEAVRPDPYDEVENGQQPCRLAYCEKHYLEHRKDAYECNYMNCEAEVTKPHPDYEDSEQCLKYCDEHYHFIKDIRSGKGKDVSLSDLEERLLVVELASTLAENLIRHWGEKTARKTLENLIEREQKESVVQSNNKSAKPLTLIEKQFVLVFGLGIAGTVGALTSLVWVGAI